MNRFSASAVGEVDREEEVRSKRQKLNNSTPTDEASVRIESLHLQCSKGLMPEGFTPKEYVLQLPPRLTKSAYKILLECNAVPRQWHLEGRFGSRTHKVAKSLNGIPVLYGRKIMEGISSSSPELKELIGTEGVSIVEKDFVHNHRTRQVFPNVDTRVHPELADDFDTPRNTPKCMDATCREDDPAFTYAEIFGGIGGFGVALESLGGKCVFYSEIDERCQETYKLNFDTLLECIHGDIYAVPDVAFPKNLDLLVAGFPCQPFSSLGGQPGFDCDKGRGILYLQLVRALELSQPRSFLFENVPGLLDMKDALSVIVKAFCGANYRVTAEICSAKGLTATKRKRLFFIGVRKDLVSSAASGNAKRKPVLQSTPSSLFDDSFFQFPYVPDLKLCSHDILDYDSLPASELEVLRISHSTWDQLAKNKRWKPAHLAWPNKHCDTLTSHYGNACGRGESQLVPSSAPHPPRRFSVRECARLMGFPNTFRFCDTRPDQGDMAHRKEGYRMVGNAVCPPLIAALAGRVLDVAGVEMGKDSSADKSWTLKGRRVARDLSCAALRPTHVSLPAGCLLQPCQHAANIGSNTK